MIFLKLFAYATALSTGIYILKRSYNKSSSGYASEMPKGMCHSSGCDKLSNDEAGILYQFMTLSDCINFQIVSRRVHDGLSNNKLWNIKANYLQNIVKLNGPSKNIIPWANYCFYIKEISQIIIGLPWRCHAKGPPESAFIAEWFEFYLRESQICNGHLYIRFRSFNATIETLLRFCKGWLFLTFYVHGKQNLEYTYAHINIHTHNVGILRSKTESDIKIENKKNKIVDSTNIILCLKLSSIFDQIFKGDWPFFDT